MSVLILLMLAPFLITASLDLYSSAAGNKYPQKHERTKLYRRDCIEGKCKTDVMKFVLSRLLILIGGLGICFALYFWADAGLYPFAMFSVLGIAYLPTVLNNFALHKKWESELKNK